jgi:hypothetical protein
MLLIPVLAFIADRVARRASPENRGELTTRNTSVPHVGRSGAQDTFLGTSGTAGGWKRGRGPSAFFRDASIVSRAPRNPPSGFT